MMKLELLVDIVTDNVDILLISESKLDESFPMGQLKIKDLMHYSCLIVISKVEV